LKHIKNFINDRINESIPKSPRGNIIGSFDSIEWFDEIDRPATLDEIGDDYVEEMLSLKYDENHEDTNNLDESVIPFSGDLKTISINLGEEQQQSEVNIDYKKLQLAKLRSVVIEKGLTSSSEAQKLKKPELRKLLGAE
jgi:hypothetical protein